MPSILWPNQHLALARTVLELSEGWHGFCLPGLARSHCIEAVLIEEAVIIGHVQQRPMTSSNLSDYLSISRTTTLRNLAALIEHERVRRSGNHYFINENWLNSEPTKLQFNGISARMFVGCRQFQDAVNLDALSDMDSPSLYRRVGNGR